MNYYYQDKSADLGETFVDYINSQKERNRFHKLKSRIRNQKNDFESENDIDMDELRLAMIGAVES